MTLSNRKFIQKSRSFTKDLKNIPIEVKLRAFEISVILANDPFDKTLNIKYLTGYNRLYRVVVLHDYRMIFSFDSDNLYLHHIAHRKDIYKHLEI